MGFNRNTLWPGELFSHTLEDAVAARAHTHNTHTQHTRTRSQACLLALACALPFFVAVVEVTESGSDETIFPGISARATRDSVELSAEGAAKDRCVQSNKT